jgi:hypothetical protein
MQTHRAHKLRGSDRLEFERESPSWFEVVIDAQISGQAGAHAGISYA